MSSSVALLIVAGAVAILFLALTAARSPWRMAGATLVVAAICGGLLFAFTASRMKASIRRFNDSQFGGASSSVTTVITPEAPEAPTPPPLPDLVPALTEMALRQVDQYRQNLKDFRINLENVEETLVRIAQVAQAQKDLDRQRRELALEVPGVSGTGVVRPSVALPLPVPSPGVALVPPLTDAAVREVNKYLQNIQVFRSGLQEIEERLSQIRSDLTRQQSEQAGADAAERPLRAGNGPAPSPAAVWTETPAGRDGSQERAAAKAPMVTVSRPEIKVQTAPEGRQKPAGKNAKNTSQRAATKNSDPRDESPLLGWLGVPIVFALLLGAHGVLKANTRRLRQAAETHK